MKGVLIPSEDGGWTGSFSGASFDLEPLFEDFFGDSGLGIGEEEKTPCATACRWI